MARTPHSKSTLYCSFCGKSQHEVKKLIAGPTVFICDECVDICMEIILSEEGDLDISRFEECFPQIWGKLSQKDKNFFRSALEVLNTDPLYSIEGLQLSEGSVFYLGPFCSPFNEIYQDQIRPAIEELHLNLKRADEIFGTQPIMKDIWDSIFQSTIIVADLTGKNPNVLYEVGIAHALGKPTIMLTQDLDDIPFDLRHYRCILYENTPRGAVKLSDTLKNTITTLSKVDYTLAKSRVRRTDNE